MPAAPVLDSHALLALLRDEPGAQTVATILEKAGQRDQPVHMTEVNYAEVSSRSLRSFMDDSPIIKNGYASAKLTISFPKL